MTSGIMHPRTRRTCTKYQVQILESVFEQDPYPDCICKDNLAAHLGMRDSAVQKWFENRRRKQRKNIARFKESIAAYRSSLDHPQPQSLASSSSSNHIGSEILYADDPEEEESSDTSSDNEEDMSYDAGHFPHQQLVVPFNPFPDSYEIPRMAGSDLRSSDAEKTRGIFILMTRFPHQFPSEIIDAAMKIALSIRRVLQTEAPIELKNLLVIQYSRELLRIIEHNKMIRFTTNHV